ncbi:GSU2403 family nucleotidyltransferase fold protein [Variovorax sp. J31P179]|uniref:GSU2403 family nucleotidyltransferase fold protein n=1 Tax=Variovorax sp. J31P179 TaxID=3053508 RepID=UPI00257632E8|nr:GSU2403 family nucleotidyltransferase fold protein [Variovorax sp. J31P179]MDM0085533.1 GSU2403 family nucleotidyltransferase fold protein [Variovorax sp. J31P179]
MLDAAYPTSGAFDLTGSFNKKEIKGIQYWYWQFRDLEGKLKQVYLDPVDERLSELIRLRSEGKAPGHDSLARLSLACTSLGCMTVMPQHFKVIHRLAEHGFFNAGGVLIGTHAFIAMGNMLGVRWNGGWRTNDIDFAHAGKNVSLALATNAEANVHDAITSLEMGLLPANSITTGQGATYLNSKSGDLRIDLLTVAGRNDAIYRHEPLNVNLQPLKFMEFSPEKTTQTAVISGENALVVNIPSPLRYALHKLVVMAEREEQFRTKIAKDAGQVAALVSYALERSPYALQGAAEDIMARGKGWRSRIAEGTKILATYHPSIAANLSSVLKLPAPKVAEQPIANADEPDEEPSGDAPRG